MVRKWFKHPTFSSLLFPPPTILSELFKSPPISHNPGILK